MDYPTRIFSWGYYEYVSNGVVQDAAAFRAAARVPLCSPFSEDSKNVLLEKLLDACRDFDSFFIEDFYPTVELEKILIDRLKKITARELGQTV